VASVCPSSLIIVVHCDGIEFVSPVHIDAIIFYEHSLDTLS
jgi:hypothetical protein